LPVLTIECPPLPDGASAEPAPAAIEQSSPAPEATSSAADEEPVVGLLIESQRSALSPEPAPAEVPPETEPPQPVKKHRRGQSRWAPATPAPTPAKIIWKPPQDPLIGKRYADVPEPKDLRAPSPSDCGPLCIYVQQTTYEPACPTCSDVGQSNQAWRSDHDPATIVFSKCLHTVQVRDVRVGRRLKL
jgi:hypothetical protein